MRTIVLVAGILASLCGAQIAIAQETSQPAEAPAPPPHPHIAYLDKSRTIYVEDFDYASGTPGVAIGPDLQVRANQMPHDSSTAIPGRETTILTPRVVQQMSESLVHELKRLGYKTRSVSGLDTRPEEGILVSGIFTQTGKDGRMRLAVVPGSEMSGDFQIYVTTGSLYRPAKSLYSIEKEKSTPDPLGEPIVLNPGVATLKFSLPINAPEKTIKRSASQISAELQRLTEQAEAQGLGGSDDPVNKYSKP